MIIWGITTRGIEVVRDFDRYGGIPICGGGGSRGIRYPNFGGFSIIGFGGLDSGKWWMMRSD